MQTFWSKQKVKFLVQKNWRKKSKIFVVKKLFI